MEAEPAHKVRVNAKGDYDYRSDKLECNGQQINVDNILIQGVATKEDCLKSNVRHGHMTIYMIDSVFSAFVDLLRGSRETGEIVVALDAQQDKEFPDIIRLWFDGIEMTRSVGTRRAKVIREQTHYGRA